MDREVRPMVVVNQREGKNELTAAIWDEDLGAWKANDGRHFDGQGPDEDEDLLVVLDEPALGERFTESLGLGRSN